MPKGYPGSGPGGVKKKTAKKKSGGLVSKVIKAGNRPTPEFEALPRVTDDGGDCHNVVLICELQLSKTIDQAEFADLVYNLLQDLMDADSKTHGNEDNMVIEVSAYTATN